MGDLDTPGFEWDASCLLLDEQAIFDGEAGQEFSGGSCIHEYYVLNDSLEARATAGLQPPPLQQQGEALLTGQVSQYLLPLANHSGSAGTSSTFSFEQPVHTRMPTNSQECATGVTQTRQPWPLPNSSTNPQTFRPEVTQRMRQNGDRDPKSPASVGTVSPPKQSRAVSEKKRRDTQKHLLIEISKLLPHSRKRGKASILERTVQHIKELQNELEQSRRENRTMETLAKTISRRSLNED